jgi:ATP-binding cassette, subfamily B, bacterial PglK
MAHRLTFKVVSIYRIKKSLMQSGLGRSFQVLSPKDQVKVLLIGFLQICLGFLDLLGLVAIGLLGALSVSGVQSQEPTGKILRALQILHLENFSFQTQTIYLGLSAILLLVGRTFLSVIATRKILFFLSQRGATVSANLVARLLSQPLLFIQSKSTQELIYSITRGVEAIMLQILATSVVLLADVSLLLIMIVGLFILDPITALGTLILYAVIGFYLNRYMHVRAKALGKLMTELNIEGNTKIIEVFTAYRESVIGNRRNYYARQIGNFRFDLASANAEVSFLPYVSKYVIEAAILVGALLIAFAQVFLQDVTQAIATMSIFLAAGVRIAPAVLRIQQSSITIRSALGAAGSTLELIELLADEAEVENVIDSVDVSHLGFKPEIQLTNISLTYPEQTTKAVSDVTLHIPVGALVAFVGPSGAGKTTMIDVLLGILDPDAGEVLISGHTPLSAVSRWPGAISYVPQDVVITTGTIRENVSRGYPITEATDELVMSAIRMAHLEEFIKGLPHGIDTEVGERGTKISGGQRQRLGIARALFTRPHLLVLDEATSSLDGETEAAISDALSEMHGSTTVVMIAHRLSSVMKADMVVYMQSGCILAIGTFTEIRRMIPDFDRQAKLMGL